MDYPGIQGGVPHLSSQDNRRREEREVAEFINRKKHIKLSELFEDLLNNQLLKAVIEEYYMELLQGVLQYDRVSTLE